MNGIREIFPSLNLFSLKFKNIFLLPFFAPIVPLWTRHWLYGGVL